MPLQNSALRITLILIKGMDRSELLESAEIKEVLFVFCSTIIFIFNSQGEEMRTYPLAQEEVDKS